jgi:hypothetical protein
MNLADILEQTIQKQVRDRLQQDAEQKQFVVDKIMSAFTRLRKKPVPDLAQRTARLLGRVQKLVEDLSVEFKWGRLVVKSAGSSESLLTELRRGTDWYDPLEEIDDIIVAAVMVDPKRS